MKATWGLGLCRLKAEAYSEGGNGGSYHISDMIPGALPQRVAGAGLTRSLFLVPRTLDSTVHCVSSLTSINTVMYAGQVSLVDRSSCNSILKLSIL